MATPDEPVSAQPREPEPTTPPPHHRPWGWIVACSLLGLIAIGLVIWALNLNSDLDHQKDQTAAAQQQAAEAGQQADDLTKTVNDAVDQIAQAGDDAQQEAESALENLKSKLAALVEKLKQAANGSESGEAAPTATEAAATP